MNDLMLFQDDLFTRLDSVWPSLFQQQFDHSSFLPTLQKSGYPKVNISNTDKDTIIEATIPGLTKDNVKVEWKDDILTIKNNISTDKKEKDRNYYVREIHKSSFSRSFNVPSKDYNVDEIVAKVENGMLIVNIPQVNVIKEDKTKKITIQ